MRPCVTSYSTPSAVRWIRSAASQRLPGFSGYWSGKKNRPQERENKMCFFLLNAYRKMHSNYYVFIALGEKPKVIKNFRSTEADRLSSVKFGHNSIADMTDCYIWPFLKYGRLVTGQPVGNIQVMKYTPIFVNQNGKFRNFMNIRNSVLTIKDYR